MTLTTYDTDRCKYYDVHMNNAHAYMYMHTVNDLQKPKVAVVKHHVLGEQRKKQYLDWSFDYSECKSRRSPTSRSHGF